MCGFLTFFENTKRSEFHEAKMLKVLKTTTVAEIIFVSSSRLFCISFQSPENQIEIKSRVLLLLTTRGAPSTRGAQ